MARTSECRWMTWMLLGGLGWAGLRGTHRLASAEEPVVLPMPAVDPASAPPIPITLPAPSSSDRPLPINLPTALRLANVQALDIALASQRIQVALAQLEQARVLW